MSRKEFDSEYDFYRMEEEQRIALIGSRFTTKGRDSLYFPLGLVGGFNYGVEQGLIFVSPVMKYKEKKWFRVGVCSPDDLDMDLDFGPEDTHKRNDIITFLIEKVNKKATTYECVLGQIQKEFGGERTS